jgi:hypothetical protein
MWAGYLLTTSGSTLGLVITASSASGSTGGACEVSVYFAVHSIIPLIKSLCPFHFFISPASHLHFFMSSFSLLAESWQARQCK